MVVSVGLVYMRPRRLAGFSVASADGQSVARCWSLMLDWIVRKGLIQEIELGYGFFRDEPERAFTACIELPEVLTIAEVKELDRVMGPGGAFYRQRLTSDVGDISGAINAFRDDLDTTANMKIDVERPLVSVLIGLKDVQAGAPVRCNLLVPVCKAEQRQSDTQAA